MTKEPSPRSMGLALPWAHPWLTLSVALRTLLETDWGADSPGVRGLIPRVIELRARVRRAGWFN